MAPGHSWVPGLANKATDWVSNEVDNKPDDGEFLNDYHYIYTNMNHILQPVIVQQDLVRTVTDPHESMAFVSRPHTGALGAGAPGPIFNESVNMRVTYGFSYYRYDHSGQFQRDIQYMYENSNGIVWSIPFYTRLMRSLHVEP
jgi:hypothetical protein